MGSNNVPISQRDWRHNNGSDPLDLVSGRRDIEWLVCVCVCERWREITESLLDDDRSRGCGRHLDYGAAAAALIVKCRLRQFIRLPSRSV